MTDLKEFITALIDSTNTDKKIEDISLFLVSNEWFGIKPVKDTGGLYLSDGDCMTLRSKLYNFLSSDSTDDVLHKLFLTYPITHGYLTRFLRVMIIDSEDAFYIADFLLYRMKKEIYEYTDSEMEKLIDDATMDLIRLHGEILTFFLSWLKERTRTKYRLDYVMQKRFTQEETNVAYDFDEYMELMYYLFNEDYIKTHHMYEKAAESMNYVDTWLYLSLHFICSLRITDFERIYHPDLIHSPEETIEMIRNNTFSDNDARMTLLSITTRMCLLPLKPNKTKRHSGISSVKFHIPTSCEVHFGKLFALAEAHRQLNGKADMPIIRKVATYKEIMRNMGDEIGSLFLESDFRGRSANKSYLQAVFMLADDVLGEQDEGPKIKGYILAALARSHKGSYGEFAATTFEYLKDSKLNGLTPEFVAFEMLERGACSFITTMLLKMLGGENYERLDVKEQTQAHMSLQLSPMEIDNMIAAVNKSSRLALKAVKEAIDSGQDILTTLHRIATDASFSKTSECLCLRSALKQPCFEKNRRSCIGCPYEISTKSTMYLLIGELNRMRNLYQKVANKAEKQKYKALIQELILPKMNEILYCLKTEYGEDVYHDFEDMIKENT